MINTKSGPVYTLCLNCAPQDFIPCLNPDREPCDSCHRVAHQVTYGDHIPGKPGDNDPARIAAKAIIRGMDRPRVKIPRRHR